MPTCTRRIHRRGATQGIRLNGKAASAAAAETRRAAARRHRRPFGSAVLHAPQVLRALVRADEIWLVVLAAFLGCGTGIMRLADERGDPA